MRHCTPCNRALADYETWCERCGTHPTSEMGGQLAPLARRAAAGAIDAATLVLWVGAVMWIDSMGQADFFDPPYSIEENGLIGGTLALVVAVLWLGLTGRSIGKAALGLSVVNGEGHVASIPSLLLRETVGKLLSFAPAGAGYFAAFFDEQHQAFHDRIAKTFVVYHDATERRRLRRKSRGSAARRRRSQRQAA